jgi:hypothetical protein
VIDRLTDACWSALDRAASAVVNAFDAIVNCTAHPFGRAWDAVVYDFPHWLAQKARRR